MRGKIQVLTRGIVIGLAAMALLWVVREVAIHLVEIPPDLEKPPPQTVRAVDRQGRVLSILPNPLARECYPISLHEMGRWVPAVTVGIEDRRFHDHAGVDLFATAASAWRNLTRGRLVSGGSTITQQLLKIASGRKDRSFHAKAREVLAAWKLERLWSKDKILEEYLNRIDYGNRRIGIEAAARAYFGKPAGDLTPAEAIYLAGLPQSPTRLNPWNSPVPARERYLRNAERIAESGIVEIPAETLKKSPPVPRRFDPPSLAPHFVRAVQKLPAQKGKDLHTCLDLDLQTTVEHLASLHVSTESGRGFDATAVVVMENSTGRVLAYVSSGGALGADMASALRSCGSTLKPFLYLAAIDRRLLTAASILPDTPDAITREYRDYDPKNYSRRYFGPVRVREALANSMNVPAVLTLSQLGARDFFESLHAWGFSLPGGFSAYGAGFILGNAPVTALELAGAYAGMARGGTTWPAKLIPFQEGDVQHTASPEACRIVADVLCDDDARTRSFGPGSALALPWRTAVKTGTSSRFVDGWCAGFSRDHTVVVWAGNRSSRPMGEVPAVRSAAPLWNAIMRHLYSHGSRPVPPPTPSEKLLAKQIDHVTGLLPGVGDRTLREWFLPGTEPTQNSSASYENGRLALPSEYAGWVASSHNRLGAVLRSPKLEILFPKDGAVFSINPAISRERQQIVPVSSSLPSRWLLNGVPADSTGIVLTPGSHVLRAENSSGSSEVRFTVE